MIGMLGVGALATSMLSGFRQSGVDATSVLLSPFDRGMGRALAELHGYHLAADNIDLVERSDVIILAVRPADVSTAVADLPWRKGQIVISVCAGVPISELSVGSACVVRAIPLTASEIGASPTVYYPDVPAARNILARLGHVIPLASEAEFEVATVCAAVYGWVHELIRLSANWSTTAGLTPAVARQLTALTFVAAGRHSAEKPEPMDQLLQELATPGGITELGLQVLEQRGVSEAWDAACSAVLEKLVSSAPAILPTGTKPTER